MGMIPKSISMKIDAERYGIEEFVKFASKKLSHGSVLLDAGAGRCPYKAFLSKTNYIAVDISKKDRVKLDVIASIDSLPFRDNCIDAVLCTQVLEHVKEPSKVLLEFHRVLTNSGELFITVPQGWGLHDKPYDYFRFTSYALRFLFDTTGFNTIFIKPRGGYFWYIGNRLRFLPSYIRNRWLRLICSYIFRIIIPLICFYLDILDQDKDWTLGYACYCKKLEDASK